MTSTFLKFLKGEKKKNGADIVNQTRIGLDIP